MHSSLPPMEGSTKLLTFLPVRSRPRFVVRWAILVAVVGVLSVSAVPARDAKADTSGTAVLTYHNDNLRTGQNLTETQLTTTNVNPTTFGKKFALPVDGQVYAQPLYVPQLDMGVLGVHNVVFVATEHDSVYAFDATTGGQPLWHTSFLNPANSVTSLPSSLAYESNGSGNITPEVGITSTPVIDPTTNTIYVVAVTARRHIASQNLHALDITTGLEKPNSPSLITAKILRQGSKHSFLTFNPMRQLQRSALLLSNGVVYITWASYGDINPYKGWIMGYDATTLAQKSGIVTTPNGIQGGIWESGNGLAADAQGSIYGVVGNGTYSPAIQGGNVGQSVFRLVPQSTGLSLADKFTPFNAACMNKYDTDLGSGGALLLPDQSDSPHTQLLLTGGKEGRLYLLDRTNLGGFAIVKNFCAPAVQARTTYDKIVQELPPRTINAIFSTPTYWDSGQAHFIYIGGARDTLKAFSVQQGLLSTTPVAQTTATYSYPGVTASVTSNGTTSGTGLVWTVSADWVKTCVKKVCTVVGEGILHAYDATNISQELYSSATNLQRDGLDSYVKFSVPTVADGMVFVGTADSLSIYGLLS